MILAAVIAEAADNSQPALSTQPTALPTADDSEPTMSTPSAASSAPGAEASTDPGPTVVDFGLMFGEPMVGGVAEDLLASTMLAGIDDREDVGAIVDFCDLLEDTEVSSSDEEHTANKRPKTASHKAAATEAKSDKLLRLARHALQTANSSEKAWALEMCQSLPRGWALKMCQSLPRGVVFQIKPGRGATRYV